MFGTTELRTSKPIAQVIPDSCLARYIIAILTVVFLSAAHVRTAPGELDTSFGDGGVSLTYVLNNYTGYNGPSTMLLQPDGKILVCGQIDIYGDDGQFFLARLTPSGSLDPTFGYQGIIVSSYNDPYVGADMALQPDGRIVVVGNHGDHVVLQRYDSNGDLDLSFGDGGTALLEIDG